MAGPQQCNEIDKAVKQTALMGIKLAGDAAQNIDDLLAKALKSEAVQNEVRKTLDEIARANLESVPLTFSGQEAKKFATSLAERGFTAVRQEVWNYTLKSPQYLRLRRSAEGVLDALKCSPTGIWYEKKKKLIYILATGMVVAGAVGMYIARAGDEVMEPLSDLIKDKKVTVKPIGTLELSAGSFNFEPSKREFQVELGLAANMKQVKLELSMTGQAIDADLQIASARGRVIIPFGKIITKYEVSYDPDDVKSAPVQLGLGIEFGQGRVRFDLAGRLHFRDNRPVGGSVAAGIKGTHGNVPFSVRAEGRSEALYGNAILGTYSLLW